MSLAVVTACGSNAAGNVVDATSSEAQRTPATLGESGEIAAEAVATENNGVLHGGQSYECESVGEDRYDCSAGTATLYCNGVGAEAECSDSWYPDGLDGFDVITYGGTNYVCSVGGECQAYAGGPPPPVIVPEIWCNFDGCVAHDPTHWFELNLDFDEYLCEDASGFQQYDCYDYAGGAAPIAAFEPDVYCSGTENRPECSELWYPDDLARYDVVDYGGSTYLCLLGECEWYDGGRPPLAISGELWCDGYGCTEYDSNRWFEVAYGFSDYLCEEAPLGFQKYDCHEYRGGAAPTLAIGVDLYCSGSESLPDCSELWYPVELDDVELVAYGSQTYLCERALLGGWNDYDCGAYTGGDPDFVWTGALKCTDSGWSFECDPDYYPSELEGLFFVTIGFSEYVCENTWQGYECFSYWGGSPRSAIGFWPDYYCNSYGCSGDGYP
jgi:hypothetical protein